MKKLFLMFLAVISVTALTACSNGFDGSTVISSIDGVSSTYVSKSIIDSGYNRYNYATEETVNGVTTYTSYGTYYKEYDYENEFKYTYKLFGTFLTKESDGMCEITSVSSKTSYESSEKKYDYYTFDYSFTSRTYNSATFEYEYTNYKEFNKVFYSYYNIISITEEDLEDLDDDTDVLDLIKKIEGCEIVTVSKFSLSSGIILSSSSDDIEFFNEVSLKFI